MEAVRSLSNHMVYLTRDAYDQSQRYAGYNNWTEQDAIAQLRNLMDAAENFDRAVDNYYYTPSSTEYEFQRLNQAYQYAQAYFSRLSSYRVIYNTFSDMQDVMQALRYYYMNNGVPYPRPIPYPRPYPYPQPYPVYPRPAPYPNPYPYPTYPGTPGRPNPPAQPVRPAPPSYRPAPSRPAPIPRPAQPGHRPGQPNPGARPIGH
jgi:hypothetical protein